MISILKNKLTAYFITGANQTQQFWTQVLVLKNYDAKNDVGTISQKN